MLSAYVSYCIRTAYRHTDTAYHLVRADKIAERLEQIRSGEAPQLLAEVDARERDRSTWCVGVRWEYSREDLADIVRVSRVHFQLICLI